MNLIQKIWDDQTGPDMKHLILSVGGLIASVATYVVPVLQMIALGLSIYGSWKLIHKKDKP